MLRYTVPIMLASLAVAAPAFAQGGTQKPQGPVPHEAQSVLGEEGKLSQKDKLFLSDVAKENQGEIRVSLLAEKKASDPAELAFARLMVFDHTEVENQLRLLDRAAGEVFPNGVSQQDDKWMTQLQPLEGTQFDRAFIAAQIQGHKHQLHQFAQEVHETQDPAVKNFALLTMATLQQHLDLAQAVQLAMQSAKTASNSQ